MSGHRTTHLATRRLAAAAFAVIPFLVSSTPAYAVSASGIVSQSASRSADHAVALPTWPQQSCTVYRGRVHFRSASAAMRYLARAYNCGDVRALRRVTNPAARSQLLWMTTEAVHLRLDSCTANNWATDFYTFSCRFTHEYPTGVAHDNPDASGRGQAFLSVFPADRPGWYATVVGCG